MPPRAAPLTFTLGSVIRAVLIFILVSSLLGGLASCGEENRSAPNVELLSTDVYVSVGQHTLVLPFIALDDYAYRKQSFSLNRKGDSGRAGSALEQFLRESADPNKPLVLDELSVVVGTYGTAGEDTRSSQMCPMLTHEWAQSVCDNPWAAVQQALPINRFRLVDLRRLQIDDPRRPGGCLDNGKLRRPLPQDPGEAVMICESSNYDGNKDRFHSAVVRIDGDIGALWTVWQYAKSNETAESMTEREGKAIVAFVRYALGLHEDFPALHSAMCGLRRPGSVDNPHGGDCGRAALAPLSRS